MRSKKNEKILESLSNGSEWRYFRYPYSREGDSVNKRNKVRDYLFHNNYRIAHVTIDFEDWAWNDPYARCIAKKDSKSIMWLKQSYIQNALDHLKRADIAAKSLFGRSIPHILVIHIGTFDTEMIRELILEYRKKGVTFIPMSKALEDEVYNLNPNIISDKGIEFTYQVMMSRGLTQKDLGIKSFIDFPQQKLETICR